MIKKPLSSFLFVLLLLSTYELVSANRNNLQPKQGKFLWVVGMVYLSSGEKTKTTPKTKIPQLLGKKS